MHELTELQKRLWEWQQKNFLPETRTVPLLALGMAEEVGELCHHVLKGAQKIRSGVNGVNEAEIIDAVCDTMIFGLNLLSTMDVNAGAHLLRVAEDVMERDWTDNPEGSNAPIQKS